MRNTLKLGRSNAKQPDRTPGREGELTREERMKAARERVGGHRSKLTVHGKDPAMVYRWVLDSTSNGQKLMQMRQLGFELASADDVGEIGESFVQQADGNVDGSVVRAPSGDGKRYLFLMKCDRQMYEDNKAVMQERIDAIEETIFRKANPDAGEYGEVKRETRPRYPG